MYQDLLIKSTSYQNYLNVQMLITENISPQPKQEQYENIYQNQSQQFSKTINKNLSLRQTIFNQLKKQRQRLAMNKKSMIFTRQNTSIINKKQRDLRKHNYQKIPQLSIKKQLQNESLLIVKQVSITKIQNSKSKRPFSSSSSCQIYRKNHSQQNKFTITRPQTSQTHTRPITSSPHTRPTTSLTKITSNNSCQNYLKFRLDNPLVIYPFQSKLKIKRIDENPKILSNIITRKNKVMEKHQLYDYVNKLMHRRLT